MAGAMLSICTHVHRVAKVHRPPYRRHTPRLALLVFLGALMLSTPASADVASTPVNGGVPSTAGSPAQHGSGGSSGIMRARALLSQSAGSGGSTATTATTAASTDASSSSSSSGGDSPDPAQLGQGVPMPYKHTAKIFSTISVFSGGAAALAQLAEATGAPGRAPTPWRVVPPTGDAWQSSTDNGGDAPRAVDGNTNTLWANLSCTQTGREVRPLWATSLGAPITVAAVQIYNRQDCCSERLTNFVIRVGDERPDTRDGDGIVGASNPVCKAVPGSLPGGLTTLVCDTPLTGRYLSVQLVGAGVLTLCEVVVLAVPTCQDHAEWCSVWQRYCGYEWWYQTAPVRDWCPATCGDCPAPPPPTRALSPPPQPGVPQSAPPPSPGAGGCPVTPTKYTFTSRWDRFGADIYCKPIDGVSVDELAARCDATPTCKAFNIYGDLDWPSYCLKTEAEPIQDFSDNLGFQSPCFGTFRRLDRVAAGYTYSPQKDRVGADIECLDRGNMSVQDVADRCSTTPGCVGFNLFLRYNKQDDPAYCLKSSAEPLVDGSDWYTDPNTGFFTRDSPVECQVVAPPGFAFTPQWSLVDDADYETDDIECKPRGGQSVADLAARCLATRNCRSFTLSVRDGDPSQPTYCLKNNAWPIKDYSSTQQFASPCSGIFRRLDKVAVGYTFSPGMDRYAANIGECLARSGLDVQEIADRCTLTPSCMGFNLFGNFAMPDDPRYCLKSSAAPLTTGGAWFADPNTGFFTRGESTACPGITGYGFQHGTDVVDCVGACDDLGDLTMEGVARMCDADPSCGAFTIFRPAAQYLAQYCLKPRGCAMFVHNATYMGEPCLGHYSKLKRAWQSSTVFGAEAGRAVDGNTNPDWNGGSCTHTPDDDKAYWAVDLGAPTTVSAVQIYNRADCCWERLKNFTIRVGDERPDTRDGSGIVGSTNNVCKVQDGELPPGPTTLLCDKPLTGRYLSVQRMVYGPLTLCEVIVLSDECSTPTPAGYTFDRRWDHFGSDIECNSTDALSVEDLARRCQATPGCKAFNQFWSEGNPNKAYYCLKWEAEGVQDFSAKPEFAGACTGIYRRVDQVVPGYTFSPRMDVRTDESNIGDCMLRDGMSAQEIADRCSDTPNCVGFNLHLRGGKEPAYCLKSVAEPLTDGGWYFPDPNTGFFIRDSTPMPLPPPSAPPPSTPPVWPPTSVCPFAVPPGYAFTPQWDYIGAEMECQVNASLSVEDLAQWCQDTPGCRAFNMFWADGDQTQRTYCLKSMAGPIADLTNDVRFFDSCSGIFRRLDSIVPGYIFSPNMDRFGADISCDHLSSMDAQTVADRCSAIPSCTGFDLHLPPDSPRYCLKSSAMPLTVGGAWFTDPNAGFFTRGSTVDCPTFEGYRFEHGADMPFCGDIERCRDLGDLTMDDVARMCAVDPSCGAFTMQRVPGRDQPQYCRKTALCRTVEYNQTYMVEPCLGLYRKTGDLSCPVIEGFKFTEGKDAIGCSSIHCGPMGDLTVADVAKLCNANTECASFNINRHSWYSEAQYCLKPAECNQLVTSADTMFEPCRGIYTRATETCPPVAPDGYTFEPHWDFRGADIECKPRGANLSVMELAHRCTSTPGCKSFNIYRRGGDKDMQMYCLKREAGPIRDYSGSPQFESSCTGIFRRLDKVAVGYTFSPNMNRYAADIGDCMPKGNLSTQDVADRCSDTPNCVGFSLFLNFAMPSDPQYCLKSSAQPLTDGLAWFSDPNMGFFTRGGPPACPALPGFKFKHDTDVVDCYSIGACNDLGSLTIEDVARMCDAEPSCGLFTIFRLAAQYLAQYCLRPHNCALYAHNTGYMAEPCLGLYSKSNSSTSMPLSPPSAPPPSSPPASVCPFPVPPGYAFTPQWDFFGADIECQPIGSLSVEDLAQRCQDTPGCKAFNMFWEDGYQAKHKYCLKSMAGPIADNTDNAQFVDPCSGIFRRLDKVAVGYTFSPNMNRYAADIGECVPKGNLSTQDVADRCSSTPACVGFSLFLNSSMPSDPQFCLKSSAQPLADGLGWFSDPNSGFFTRGGPPACPALPGYKLEQGTDVLNCFDLGSGDLGEYTIEMVARQCYLDARCVSFTISVTWIGEHYVPQYAYKTRDCKEYVRNPTYMDAPCLGIYRKTNVSCPAIPGFKFLQGIDASGCDDIFCGPLGNLTVASVAQRCVQNPECASFNIHRYAGQAGAQYCLKQPACNNLTKNTDAMFEPCRGLYANLNYTRFPPVPLSTPSPPSPLPPANLSCPVIKGFNFSEGIDAFGCDNIFCGPLGERTVADIAQRCVQNPECASFNIHRYEGQAGAQYCLKQAACKDLTQNKGAMFEPCRGLYTRLKESCPPAVPPGFNFTARWDHYGDDIECKPIGTLTVADLALRCEATPNCTAFNVYLGEYVWPSYCLKTVAEPIQDFSDNPGFLTPCYGIFRRLVAPRLPASPVEDPAPPQPAYPPPEPPSQPKPPRRARL